MNTVSGWLAPLVVAVGLGALVPAPAQARDDDELVRVIVDIADVVLRRGVPYYRHGNYGYDDRLIVVRDRYGRPLYYRQLPRRHLGGRYDDPYRHARDVRCDRNGRCTVTYYDPRHDRRYDSRYYRYDARRW